MKQKENETKQANKQCGKNSKTLKIVYFRSKGGC